MFLHKMYGEWYKIIKFLPRPQISVEAAGSKANQPQKLTESL